jgi:hypothetical protein
VRFDSLAGEGVTTGYDGVGLLVSSTSNMGGVARATGTLYDLDGNRIRVIHPDTSFFTYEVDGLGRPFRIRENGADPIVTFAYDAAGRRVSSGWAATTSYGYDAVGRLQSLSHDLVGASRDHVLGFTYNPASQIQSRSASNPAYAWGGASNAVRNYAANGLNQYTAAGPATFAHDLNGNLSSTANPSFGSTSYVYDVENRLVSASGAQSAELVYDPLGRHQIRLVDVEAVGMRDPRPAAGDVPGRGHRPLRADLGQVAAQRVVGEREAVAGLRRGGRAAEQVVGIGDVGPAARQVLRRHRPSASRV